MTAEVPSTGGDETAIEQNDYGHTIHSTVTGEREMFVSMGGKWTDDLERELMEHLYGVIQHADLVTIDMSGVQVLGQRCIETLRRIRNILHGSRAELVVTGDAEEFHGQLSAVLGLGALAAA